MKTISAFRLARDRDDRAFCFAHVTRRHPSGASSFFTSLRRTPHPPDRVMPWLFSGPDEQDYPAKGDGWPTRRSKGGEPGAARLGGHERRRPPISLGARRPLANTAIHPSPDALAMLRALRDAARKELDKKQRLGQYAVVWQNDEVIKLEADELRNLLDTLNDPRHA